jgi:ElaB/YqjD/DUF883 family membrane-anchored ribosome-binding protein
MAAVPEKDFTEHLATIRADIGSLTKTIAQLGSDTAGIHRSLAAGLSNAAIGAGGHFLSEAENFGEEAIQAAARGASAAVTGVQEEIENNPLIAVLVAVGFGVAIGFLSRGAFSPAPVKARYSRRLRRP